MRVITDFVMNHTSSEHPWFQESRRSADNPKSDWYVWSDTVHRYEDARIIFVDSEQSNWTYDPSAVRTSGIGSTTISPTSTTRTPRSGRR